MSSSSGGDDFVTAVLLAMNPDQSSGHEELHAQAVAYCERLKASPSTAWPLALSRLHSLTAADSPQVIFFCLQLLTTFVTSPAYPALPPLERSSFCSSLLIYLRDVTPLHPPPPYLRSKLATLLTSLFRVDYPDRWPSFFTDFLSLLPPLHPTVVDTFLRTLLAIDSDVVAHDWRRSDADVAVNVRIKDHLRASNDARIIMDALHSLLTLPPTSPTTLELVVSALDVVKEYVGWTDVALVANDRFMTTLYAFITSTTAVPALRDGALRCVTEVYSKKMPQDKKLDMVTQYRVLDMLASLKVGRVGERNGGGAGEEGGDGVEEGKEVAALINCVGQQLIACVPPFSTQGGGAGGGGGGDSARVAGLIESVMGLSYRVLERCPWAVVNDSELLEMVKQFIRTMTASPSLLPSHELHGRRIFHALSETMLYPSSFSFDSPSDDDSSFLEYRVQLHTVFCNLVPAMPDLCVDLVSLSIHSTVQHWRDQPWTRVEGSLRLFYDIGEALKGGVQRVLTEPMSSMISSTLRSDVSSHSHPQVSLLWMMTVHRYTRFLEAHADFVPATLTVFLDHRGLHHPHPLVRSKAAYLLYKLLLSFPDALRKTLRPHVDAMLGQLQPVVDAGLKGEGKVSAEDSNYVCEVMGILVSSSVTGDACAGYVTLVLSFFSAHLTAALAASSSWPSPPPPPSTSSSAYPPTTSEADAIGVQLAFLFDSFGCVSKPLSKDTQRTSELFERCFLSILQLFALLPHHEQVRAKTIFVIHRMVECQGVRMLTQLPVALPSLIAYANHGNIHLLLPLVNQVLIAFKAAFVPLLDLHFLPLCSKALSCLAHYAYIDHDAHPSSSSSSTPSPSAAYSTDKQERQLLQQRYYAFLRAVLMEAPQVVTSGTNVGGLRKVVDSIMRGWESKDWGTEKATIQCVQALFKHLSAQGLMQEGGAYHTWVEHDVTAAIYALLFAPHLQLTDANAYATFRELVTLQHLLLTLLPASYSAHLLEWLVRDGGWKGEQVQDWLLRLQQQDMGKCREMIMQMREKGKGAGGGGLENGSRHMNGGGGALHAVSHAGSNGSRVGDLSAFSRSSSSSTSSYREGSRNAASR